MPAKSYQLKGAATQKETVRQKVATTVDEMRKELLGPLKGTVLSIAAVARRADVPPGPCVRTTTVVRRSSFANLSSRAKNRHLPRNQRKSQQRKRSRPSSSR